MFQSPNKDTSDTSHSQEERNPETPLEKPKSSGSTVMEVLKRWCIDPRDFEAGVSIGESLNLAARGSNILQSARGLASADIAQLLEELGAIETVPPGTKLSRQVRERQSDRVQAVYDSTVERLQKEARRRSPGAFTARHVPFLRRKPLADTEDIREQLETAKRLRDEAMASLTGSQSPYPNCEIGDQQYRLTDRGGQFKHWFSAQEGQLEEVSDRNETDLPKFRNFVNTVLSGPSFFSRASQDLAPTIQSKLACLKARASFANSWAGVLSGEPEEKHQESPIDATSILTEDILAPMLTGARPACSEVLVSTIRYFSVLAAQNQAMVDCQKLCSFLDRHAGYEVHGSAVYIAAFKCLSDGLTTDEELSETWDNIEATIIKCTENTISTALSRGARTAALEFAISLEEANYLYGDDTVIPSITSAQLDPDVAIRILEHPTFSATAARYLSRSWYTRLFKGVFNDREKYPHPHRLADRLVGVCRHINIESTSKSSEAIDCLAGYLEECRNQGCLAEGFETALRSSNGKKELRHSWAARIFKDEFRNAVGDLDGTRLAKAIHFEESARLFKMESLLKKTERALTFMVKQANDYPKIEKVVPAILGLLGSKNDELRYKATDAMWSLIGKTLDTHGPACIETNIVIRAFIHYINVTDLQDHSPDFCLALALAPVESCFEKTGLSREILFAHLVSHVQESEVGSTKRFSREESIQRFLGLWKSIGDSLHGHLDLLIGLNKRCLFLTDPGCLTGEIALDLAARIKAYSASAESEDSTIDERTAEIQILREVQEVFNGIEIGLQEFDTLDTAIDDFCSQ